MISGISFEDAVRMFNCNVNYGGLVHAVTAEGWFKENKVRFRVISQRNIAEFSLSRRSDSLLRLLQHSLSKVHIAISN